MPDEIDDEAFWQEFHRRCRAVAPDAYLVGEIWEEAPEWLRGDRFDALMNYPLGTAILGFAGGASLDLGLINAHATYRLMFERLDAPGFARRLERLMTNYDPAVVAVQLNLLGSHDTPRALSVVGGDRAALRLAMLLQLTLPGAPCIYYGDEIGMTGGLEPDCRVAFPVSPLAGDRELRAFVRAAIAARHAHRALRRGGVRVAATGAAALALVREADGDRALVALNAGGSAERLSLELPGSAWWSLSPVALPGGMEGVRQRRLGKTLELDLPGQSALVLVED